MKKLFLIASLALSTLVAHAQYNMSDAQAPFQSTSTMPASGSKYSSNPIIGENGIATYNSSQYSPNRVGFRRNSESSGTPTTPGSDGEHLPIGDFPVALLFSFVIIYIAILKIRSERRIP